MFLPFEYDDEGKQKTYTEKEKKELRGDDKTKPGYQSKMEEIAQGDGSQAASDPAAEKEKRTTPTRTRKKTRTPRPTMNRWPGQRSKMVVLDEGRSPEAKSPGGRAEERKKTRIDPVPRLTSMDPRRIINLRGFFRCAIV